MDSKTCRQSHTAGQQMLDDLLFDLDERSAADRTSYLETLCQEHPEHSQALREGASHLDQLDNLLFGGGPSQTGDFPGMTETKLIGSGGMGLIYRAFEVDLQRYVAVKCPKLGQLTPETAERFKREARILAQLRHANIVSILYGKLSGNSPYFVMDYVPGGSLKLLAAEYTDPLAALKLIETVARAVHFAHQQGYIHRDLKPSNILIRESDRACLVADFGVARLRNALEGDLEGDDVGSALESAPSSGDLTRTGARLGTAAYMSPEQLAGKAADARTDVWALGKILEELVFGKSQSGKDQPEKNATGTEAAVVGPQNDASAAHPKRQKEPSWVLQQTRRLVDACTQFDAEDRLHTAEAVAEAAAAIARRATTRRTAFIRWLTAAAVVLLGVLLASAYWFNSPPSDQQANNGTGNPGAGDSIEFAPADGYVERPFGKGGVTVEIDPQSVDGKRYIVTGEVMTFAEFLSNIWLENVRITCQVQDQETHGISPSVGLTVGGFDHIETAVPRSGYWLQFRDSMVEPKADDLRVRFQPYWLEMRGRMTPSPSKKGGLFYDPKLEPRSSPPEPKWHDIEITIVDDTITVRFDGEPLTDGAGAKSLPIERNRFKEVDGKLTGSVGVIVESGRAAIRNLKVEPIPKD